MGYVFIAGQKPIKELLGVVAAFEAAGYDTDKAVFGVAWAEFLTTVPEGATVVVYSLDFFGSLMELLATLAQLQERGIALKSLQEPWISQEVTSTTDFLAKLRELGVKLHRNRTKQGIKAAQARGVKVGRPVGYRKTLL